MQGWGWGGGEGGRFNTNLRKHTGMSYFFHKLLISRRFMGRLMFMWSPEKEQTITIILSIIRESMTRIFYWYISILLLDFAHLTCINITLSKTKEFMKYTGSAVSFKTPDIKFFKFRNFRGLCTYPFIKI
jgi:hypothetical protein